jgi:hypothetical protein
MTARIGPAQIGRSESRAASITPASSPGHPACTTPTAPGATRAIGAQSAVSTTNGRPTVVVTAASASGGESGARSTATTAVPCTWRNQTHAAGSSGVSRVRPARRARFSATDAGSSPTWSPTFSVS